VVVLVEVVVVVVFVGVVEVVVGVVVEVDAFCQVHQPALSASWTEAPPAIAALYL
jgi:hypothetical protein